MTYRNTITYTTATGRGGARHEAQYVTYTKGRKLTIIGSQRILRRFHPSAIVTRVEVTSC